jgi:pyruvate/2-oxoglutarate dehydrogenase complex dihydrolipoamide dehydrogenase (E3) component
VEGRVRISEGVGVETVERRPHGLRLHLSDGATRDADHVVLATGYRFRLDALEWLSPQVRGAIALEHDWPVLDRSFQSTAQGLYFVGYAAEGRFGPLSRFVLGAEFAARRVAEAVSRR